MTLPYSYEEWVQMGQFIPLKDGRVFYVLKGDGFPIIMMDYLGGNSWWFSRVVNASTQHFKTYVIDLPGHGQSEEPPHPYGPPEYADFLEEFMDTLGIEKAHLLGGHGSALTAVHFATTRPVRVAKLVLDGISAWTREEGEGQWARWVSYGWVDENDEPRPYEEWGGMKVQFPGLRDEEKQIALNRTNEDFSKHGRWWASTMKEALKYDVHPRLHLVQAQTLMVNGENEGEWVKRGEQSVLNGIRGARLEIINEAGARPGFMRPDDYSKVVLEFLNH